MDRDAGLRAKRYAVPVGCGDRASRARGGPSLRQMVQVGPGNQRRLMSKLAELVQELTARDMALPRER